MGKEEILVYGLFTWTMLMWGIYLILENQNKDE